MIRASKLFSKAFSRNFSSAASSLPKACVVGAAGGIGQPLSLLMKNSKAIGDLSLYDIIGTPGVAADLSHICTDGSVKGFVGPSQLKDALDGCEAVVVPAGVPRKPGMTRDDLFNTNASIVAGIATACAEVCPNASFFIISNPVNSTVPIFAEAFKKVNSGKFNPRKLYGVTTLDVTRANTFVAEELGADVNSLDVTVIGGHAGTTILPLLSSIKGHENAFNQEQLDRLTNRIQFGGDEVVKAKDGAGSATLSMAYAANVFVEKVMGVKAGETITACAFVENEVYQQKSDCAFFATPLQIGKDGVEKIIEPSLSAYEQKVYDSMIGDLKKQVEKGKSFVLDQ